MTVNKKRLIIADYGYLDGMEGLTSPPSPVSAKNETQRRQRS